MKRRNERVADEKGSALLHRQVWNLFAESGGLEGVVDLNGKPVPKTSIATAGTCSDCASRVLFEDSD